jgi:hypothetical protein
VARDGQSEVRVTKPILEAQLWARGYRAAEVLGPLDGREGQDEYAVTILDGRGQVVQSLRGTYAVVQDWIATLPGLEPGARRTGRPGRRA